MTDITRILSNIEAGDEASAAELLPLVYDELRRLAAVKLAKERAGQTLQGTALVHEAYARLVGGNVDQKWANRAHFFAAAAEAMRRILVDRARQKQTRKQGGQVRRADVELNGFAGSDDPDPLEILAIHEILDQLAEVSPRKAELVMLRYFLGCTMAEAAQVLQIAQGTAEDDWTYARAWLRRRFLHEDTKTS